MQTDDASAASQIDVTCIDMDAADAPVAECWETLGTDERMEARRFRSPEAERRFVIRRGTLRAILAPRLGCSPSEIRYSRGQFGKPRVIASDIRFNVSSSHSLALYALTRDAEIGCDIERVDARLDFERVAARYFAPDEIANLRALPAPLRRDWFFRHWTLKEAYVKCTGLGLSLPLDSVVIAPGRDGRPVLLGNSDLVCASIELLPGYQAALVVEARAIRVRVETHPARALLRSI